MDAYTLAAFGIVVIGILALVFMILHTVKELSLGPPERPIPPPTPPPPPPRQTHQLDPGNETTKVTWPEREAS